MLKLKQLNWGLFLMIVAMCATFSLASCGDDSDDEDMQNNCEPDFSSAVVSGTFMDDSFTFVEGTATEDFADATQFRCVLYGESVTGDACDGFNFEKPDSTIIFSVPMEVGLYDLGVDYSLTFNDASVVNEVNAEIALCGAIEIMSVTETEVTGRLDADASEASKLNGTFTLARCD